MPSVKRRFSLPLIVAAMTLLLAAGLLLVGHLASPPSARLIDSCVATATARFCLGESATTLPPPDRSGALPVNGDHHVYQYQFDESDLTVWASEGTIYLVTQQIPNRLRGGQASRVQMWLARLALASRSLRAYGPSLPEVDSYAVPQQFFSGGRAWQFRQAWDRRGIHVELVVQELAPPVLAFSLPDWASNHRGFSGRNPSLRAGFHR